MDLSDPRRARETRKHSGRLEREGDVRRDVKAFDAAKRTLSIIHGRCSEILFDPEASEERKADALAFRRTLHKQFDASDGPHCCRLRADALDRAREFFREPNFDA